MNQSFTRRAGYGALLAALAALASLAAAQGVEPNATQTIAPNTATASGSASARIQRGTVLRTPAVPAAPNAPATGINADPGTQGFTGPATATEDTNTQGIVGVDASGTISPRTSAASVDTVDPGTQGITASETPTTGITSPGAQGFVGRDRRTMENLGNPDTGLGIWETQPGNVVAPPVGAPVAGGLQAPPTTAR